MTNAGQSPTVEERLSRLETLFTNVGEQVAAHNNTIDVMVANIQQLTENVNNVGEQVAAHNNTIDVLVANIQQLTENVNNLTEQTNRNFNILGQRMDSLAEQAAQDRQQAAIERQEFRREIRQIWDYLRDRNGGSSPPA